MKSSMDCLQSRGFASVHDINSLAGKSQEELLNLLQDNNPVIRTSAAENLNLTKDNEIFISEQLLKQLAVEKCLYTRISICKALETGGINTARQMLLYLGRIGHNQYHSLPDRVSLKKSYPLPRDIMARTLSNMSVCIFPLLLEVLQGEALDKISEVLDAIGFMVFYNHQLSTDENIQVIYDVLQRFDENELIQWKAIMCLSAFTTENSKRILETYSGIKSLVGAEAVRGLTHIQSRKLIK